MGAIDAAFGALDGVVLCALEVMSRAGQLVPIVKANNEIRRVASLCR
jgi:hypothetical protein